MQLQQKPAFTTGFCFYNAYEYASSDRLLHRKDAYEFYSFTYPVTKVVPYAITGNTLNRVFTYH